MVASGWRGIAAWAFSCCLDSWRELEALCGGRALAVMRVAGNMLHSIRREDWLIEANPASTGHDQRRSPMDGRGQRRQSDHRGQDERATGRHVAEVLARAAAGVINVQIIDERVVHAGSRSAAVLGVHTDTVHVGVNVDLRNRQVKVAFGLVDDGCNRDDDRRDFFCTQ